MLSNEVPAFQGLRHLCPAQGRVLHVLGTTHMRCSQRLP